jgi:plastocyanin
MPPYFRMSARAIALRWSVLKEAVMSVWSRLTFALILLAATIACGQGSTPTSPTPTTASVSITTGGFSPNAVSISTGSTVAWTNNAGAGHSVVADNGAFNSGPLAAGAQFSYPFPSAGTFTYHDGANPNMVGTVTVSGSSSPSPY